MVGKCVYTEQGWAWSPSDCYNPFCEFLFLIYWFHLVNVFDPSSLEQAVRSDWSCIFDAPPIASPYVPPIHVKNPIVSIKNTLFGQRFTSTVWDEADTLRNPGALMQAAGALRRQSVVFIPMTATPLVTKPMVCTCDLIGTFFNRFYDCLISHRILSILLGSWTFHSLTISNL